MLERLSLYNDVSLVASSPLQERITQQEFLFSTFVHSDKNKICIREKDCRRIKMCAGERLPYFNFLSRQTTIFGWHCHAMKNKNANHSIQKDYNLGNEKR